MPSPVQAKAYTTRVGAGPYPTEIFGDLAEEVRAIGAEYGTTTGRPRRVGWLDIPALRYATRRAHSRRHLRVEAAPAVCSPSTSVVARTRRRMGMHGAPLNARHPASTCAPKSCVLCPVVVCLFCRHH